MILDIIESALDGYRAKLATGFVYYTGPVSGKEVVVSEDYFGVYSVWYVGVVGNIYYGLRCDDPNFFDKLRAL